jgi:hypothetical protein
VGVGAFVWWQNQKPEQNRDLLMSRLRDLREQYERGEQISFDEELLADLHSYINYSQADSAALDEIVEIAKALHYPRVLKDLVKQDLITYFIRDLGRGSGSYRWREQKNLARLEYLLSLMGSHLSVMGEQNGSELEALFLRALVNAFEDDLEPMLEVLLDVRKRTHVSWETRAQEIEYRWYRAKASGDAKTQEQICNTAFRLMHEYDLLSNVGLNMLVEIDILDHFMKKLSLSEFKVNQREEIFGKKEQSIQ